jgi:hypothetical protein
MKRIILSEKFNDTRLGSRFNGASLREQIKPLLDNNQKVILDFVNIEEATQSFLDEIFGIFVRAFGTEYIKNKLFIENTKPSIKQTINFIISYSKKRRIV